MDAETLSNLTDQIDLERCTQLLPGLYKAFELAELNSAKRRAMWFSQVLEESIGLSATTELASGEEYEGRVDLGNTHPGDGVRYKGRGFIQLTGRAHYQAFSRWCHHRHLVANDHWFVEHPEDVAGDDFAWLSAAWFWVQPHPHDGMTFLNEAADAEDLLTATHMVNGAEHGLETRQFYYKRAQNIGDDLMKPVDPNDPDWSELMTRDELVTFVDHRLRAVLFGSDELHKDLPQLFAEDGAGIEDRLHDHNQRINKLENAAKH